MIMDFITRNKPKTWHLLAEQRRTCRIGQYSISTPAKVPVLVKAKKPVNLLDKQYFDHATYAVYGDVAAGLPEAGRDVRMNVAYRF